MNTEFWQERWSKHEIGFHQGRINEYLERFWPTLGLSRETTAFVPLCGKSLDLHWLRAQGHRVIGVEVARVAVDEFFAEARLEPTLSTQRAFTRFDADVITLLCGDFFALTAADLHDVAAVFDRASLIAMPETLRTAYANKIREILPRGATTLLVSTDYDQTEMKGPPFSVTDAEIRTLYAGDDIDVLAEFDVTESPDNARFKQRGVTGLRERIYRITADNG
jgi:thiopurine S-methyltransferase